MACSHVSDCPLFPKLNATLQIWRDSYCDTADQWRSCERFKLSASGRRVPLGLLPNGHLAQALQIAPQPVAINGPARVSGAATVTMAGSRSPGPAPGLAPASSARPSFWARLFRRRPGHADRYAAGRHAVGAKQADRNGKTMV